MPKTINNRISGLYWGLIVGDIVGSKYKFNTSQIVNKSLQSDIQNSFMQIPSLTRFTNNSELSFGIWYVLLQEKELNLEYISNIFYSWYCSKPTYISMNNKLAFNHAIKCDVMMQNAHTICRDSLSNCALMKISPLGAIPTLGYGTVEDMINFTKDILSLTNPNPLCIDMAIVYVMAIHIALQTGDPIEAFSVGYSVSTIDLTKKIMIDAIDSNKMVRVRIKKSTNTWIPTQCVDLSECTYIGIAFQNAFYQLMRLRSMPTKFSKSIFHDAIVDTIRLGGDTNTNCCVMGALLASCFGMSSIPVKWLDICADPSIVDEWRTKLYPPLKHIELFEMLKSQL